MEEDGKRRKALEIQAQLRKSYTPAATGAPPDVTGAGGAVEKRSEEGVRAGAGHSGTPSGGQKSRKDPRAARAPEAAARCATHGGLSDRPLEPLRPEAADREIAKTKPDRRENEFMLNLMILRNTLRKNAPSVEDRAKRAGAGVWEDIVAMNDLVERVQEALLRTMPEKRDEYYRAYALHGHYELRMNGPVRTARHVLISDVRLGDLCEAAMKSECILCLREGKEIGRCRLREALLEVAPPSKIQEGLWRKCEYRGAAGDVIHGRDVTI
jgi:hypothetical protein